MWPAALICQFGSYTVTTTEQNVGLGIFDLGFQRGQVYLELLCLFGVKYARHVCKIFGKDILGINEVNNMSGQLLSKLLFLDL